jgi:hypothetical protein
MNCTSGASTRGLLSTPTLAAPPTIARLRLQNAQQQHPAKLCLAEVGANFIYFCS